MEPICSSCCDSTKSLMNACDCDFKTCKKCARRIAAITCCSCDDLLEPAFVFEHFTYPRIIEYKKKYLKTIYVPDVTILDYYKNKMKVSNYAQSCPVSECEGYIVYNKCDVCHVKICLTCGEIVNDNPHACDPNPVANIEYIRANTKKCPNCRVPIERNKGCTHMFCTNCKTDFSWTSLRVMTKLGLQNEEVFNGFYLQVVRDLKIKNPRNCSPLERIIRGQGPKITRRFTELLCSFHSDMFCTSQEIDLLFEVFYRRSFVFKALELIKDSEKLYDFLIKPKFVSMPQLDVMLDKNKQIVFTSPAIKIIRLFASTELRPPIKIEYLPEQWGVYCEVALCEYLANERGYKHFISQYNIPLMTKNDVYIYRPNLKYNFNFFTEDGINPFYQKLIDTGDKIVINSAIIDVNNWQALPSNVFSFLGPDIAQKLYIQRLTNLLESEEEWEAVNNFEVSSELKKSPFWDNFYQEVKDRLEEIGDKNETLTIRFFKKLQYYAFLTLPQAHF